MITGPLRLALLQHRLRRHATFASWQDALAADIARAADAGAQLLVLPEYAAMDCIAAPLATIAEELAAACDQHDAVVAAMAALAVRHGVWLLGGSLPVRRGDAVVNHAPLFDPAGSVEWQDKHRATRFEAEQWGVTGGEAPRSFDTPWGVIGVCICYDCEFPPLARAQAAAGAWLLLVPACTDTAAGFNRVLVSARARAVENQCYVALATTVGRAPWIAAMDANHGYAAVFGPCDRGFPDDGVIVAGAMDVPGWVYATVDPARIATVRRDGAVLNHRDYPC